MRNWIKLLRNSSIIICLIMLISVSAHAEQSVNITVTEEGGRQELIAGTSGSFQVPEQVIKNGETVTVASTIYKSGDPELLSVDEHGVFHALKPGRTTVSISVYGKSEDTSGDSTDGGSTYYSYSYRSDNSDNSDNSDDSYSSNSDDDYDYNYDDSDDYDYSYSYSSDYDYGYDYDDSDYDDSYMGDHNSYLIFRAYYYFTITPDLSDVTLENTSQTVYMTNEWYSPKFTFRLISDLELNDYDSEINVTYEASNPDISVYGSIENNVISITMDKTGSTSVTITINEKQFTVHLKAILVSITKNSLLMSGKQTKQLKIKGIKKGIRWSSSNPKIVKVSSTGKVKAKKNGNAVIKAKIGDISLGCAVSVVSKNRQKAIKLGIKIGKNGTYSQERRMEKNYYDCSSLVWRAYRSNGNNFGNASYAPVAADQGKWCAKHKRLVKGGLSDKNIRNMKLNAGDLLFETGGNNSRYRGIYHVEMISGYICYGFDSNEKPILGITWANRPVDYYWHGGQMVGRP